ncbi:hypothetical protein SppYZU01_28 [Shewanella phage SppYZU01]|nr:hypothetical protein SppYZU01_28 [Shewanella phage SppYZU01]
MSFWGKLFGTEKALNGIVDGVTNGLDALVYTDEEKAADAAADRSEARKMVVQWMAATQGQNLARRLIALSITGVWLSMYLLSVLCATVAVFTDTTGVVTAEKINQVGTIAKGAAMDMNPAVMLILAFYFAAPHMGDIAKAVTGKFTQSVNKG